MKLNGWWGSYIPFPVPAKIGDVLPPSINDLPYTRLNFNEYYYPLVLGAIKALCRPETYDGSAENIQYHVDEFKQLLNGQVPFAVDLPDWEAINSSVFPGYTSYFVGQRGEGVAGSFYDYVWSGANVHFTFQDVNTSAEVGGLVRICAAWDADYRAAPIQLHMKKCDGTFIDVASVDYVDISGVNGGMGLELTDIWVNTSYPSSGRFLLKGNWTCGNL